MAKLYFRYGAMNCGKSTALLQVAFNYEERDMNVILIKPEIDTKGADEIISRIGVSRKADILAPSTLNLTDIVRKQHRKQPIGCILVDEAQFLTARQVDELLELTVKDNIPVIAYGLRSDFLTNTFPGSKRLFELAHTIEEIKTICRCGRKALFNGRKLDGRFVFQGTQVAIDGTNKVEYESLCATCYMQEKSD